MAYSTQTDLLTKIDADELIAATDDEDTGVINADRVAAAIESADAEINGYLGGRYSVPLDPVPPIIKTYSIDMALYHIFSRRLGPPEHIEKRYDYAIKFLLKAAQGTISLGVSDPEGNANNEQPEFSGPDRVFSRDSMKGW